MNLFDPMVSMTDYAVLENKYGSFMLPAFKIKSSGRDLVAELDLTVTELTVTLSLEQPSMAVIKIADEYDTESASFTAAVKSKFRLGTILVVELGYLSETLPVFKGFVAGLGAEFDELPLITVKVMDARRLMITSGVQRVMYEEKNYSDVFKKIMSKYSRVCSVECDPTVDNLDDPVSQSCSDYDFVTKELIQSGKANREFFVFNGVAYFRVPNMNKLPVMSVKLGRELFRLNMMADYLDTKVCVTGYDPANQCAVSSTAAAKSAEPLLSVMIPAPTQYFIDADATSKAKAKRRAEAIADSLARSRCYAEGELIGIPEIVPGRYLNVASADSIADRSYYLSEVVHRINGEGFVTRFEAKGWC